MKKKYGKLEELTNKDWEEMLKSILGKAVKGKQVVCVIECEQTLVAKLSLDGIEILTVTFTDDINFSGRYFRCDKLIRFDAYPTEIHKQVLKFLIEKFGKDYANYYEVCRKNEIEKQGRAVLNNTIELGKVLGNCHRALEQLKKAVTEEQVENTIEIAKEEVEKEVAEILAEINHATV